MSRFNVGDRVRVIAPDLHFDDYAAGDTATVTKASISFGVDVKWDAPHFNDARDDMRCTFLYDSEIELVEEAEA